MAEAPHVLVLGGTSEAVETAEALAGRCRVTYALAGRTAAPVLPAGAATRTGGFGGADGLAEWLAKTSAAAVIDATHPFANRIAANAAEAAARTGTPRLKLLRPAWREAPGDDWRPARDAEDAARLLETREGATFLAVGSRELRAFAGLSGRRFVVRTVDADVEIPLPGAVHVVGRGPFAVDEEAALMDRQGIETLVTRNAGGRATYAKIEAARRRETPVVMIDRPAPPPGEVRTDRRGAVAWLAERVRVRPAP